MPVKQYITDQDLDEVTDKTIDESLFEEEDEEVHASTNHAIQSGWEAAIRAIDTPRTRTYVKDFRFDDEPQLVKFLDSAPIASFLQYWVGSRAGKKSFISPVRPDFGNEGEVYDPVLAALRKARDTKRDGQLPVSWPSKKMAFSVVNFSLDEPTQQALIVTISTAGSQLRRLNDDPKIGPLDKNFWSLSKTGTGPQSAYSILPIKARDLQEDWGLDPEEADLIASRMVPQTVGDFRPATSEELDEIAREVLDALK
jgi:hypothetical protein